MERFLLAILALMVAAVAHGNENAALALAAADLRTIDIHQKQYTRYVWVVDPSPTRVQALMLVPNYWSSASVPYVPPVFQNKTGTVVMRLDLRAIAPLEHDLQRLVHTWEFLENDPKFNLLFTKATLKFAEAYGQKIQVHGKDEWDLIDVAPFQQNGKTYNQRWIKKPGTAKDFSVARVVSDHIDRNLMAELIDGTRSQAPVVNSFYLVARGMSSLEGSGVRKDVFGGKYYDFAGIPRGTGKQTDEDALFEYLQAGVVDRQLSAKEFYANRDINRDNRVAMTISEVSGRGRMVEAIRTRQVPLTVAQGLLSITHDIDDDDVDIDVHPGLNLLLFKDKAREGIWEDRNGFHKFGLWNDAGKLQEATPSKAVRGRLVPLNHRTDIIAPIHCIECHASEGGWRTAPNHVKQKLKKFGPDIFGDVNFLQLGFKSQDEAISTLVSLYSGDFEQRMFPTARNDYALNLMRVTGPWKGGKLGDIVKDSGRELAAIYNQAVYDPVDAKQALKELGVPWDTKKDKAEEVLERVCPTPKIITEGFIKEDGRFQDLTTGLKIPRTDWDFMYSFLASRYAKYKKDNKLGGKVDGKQIAEAPKLQPVPLAQPQKPVELVPMPEKRPGPVPPQVLPQVAPQAAQVKFDAKHYVANIGKMCAWACLEMALLHAEIDAKGLTEAKAAEKAISPGSLGDLLTELNRRNVPYVFSSKFEAGYDKDFLRKQLARGPILVAVTTKANGGHGILLVGLDDREVRYIDPNRQECTIQAMSREEFDRIWWGWGLAIQRKDK